MAGHETEITAGRAAIDFDADFQVLTGHKPLSWQHRLHQDWLEGKSWTVIDLPTGMGKTMVMPIWLLARAWQVRDGQNHILPTRLVYVVDRRTVVDQATDIAKSIRDSWNECRFSESIPAPAISTLRGQLADNREWSIDPSRPAIIIGTVDLIGSALLFSGYRSSYKRRPLEAGLLGQDSLLVLDEAHLSKPFEKLILTINKDWQKTLGEGPCGNPMQVIRMSATSGCSDDGKTFTLQFDGNGELTGDDARDKVIVQRFGAQKRLSIEPSAKPVDSIASAAGKIATENPGSRIVIFVRSPKDVGAVRTALIRKDKSRETKIAQLTGTMRGLERDELVTPPVREAQHERRVMQRFLKADNDPSLGECFLISTSAGEVGFDLNADHLIGDAAPLDSWIQRLGRVNRRGNSNATVILIKEKDAPDVTDYDKACIATSELLTAGMDLSPKALAGLKSKLTPEQIARASSPKPTTVELTDILLDAWSMTSITEPMPGRPEVGPWLRGIADEAPQTTIAWRAELDEPGFGDLGLDDIEEWFDAHRILTHETLTVPTSSKSSDSAEKWLQARWNQLGETLGDEQQREIGKRPVIIDRSGLQMMSLAELVAQLDRKDTSSIRNADVILPASFGGIERGAGLLDANAPEDRKADDEQTRLIAPDVADERGRHRYIRITGDEQEPIERPLTRAMPATPTKFAKLVLALEADDDRTMRLVSLVPKPERREFGAKREPLTSHVKHVRRSLDGIILKLGLPEPLKRAAQLATDWHDCGKNRDQWQRCAGRKEGEAPLGKSGGEMRRDPRGYRHEFGSLRELTDAFKADQLLDCAGKPISQDLFDLAMHLIAAHHGRGRPHFPNGGFDPDAERESDEIHTESIRRFARLQRKYGWWHLAWLEDLLRCADAIASVQVNDDESQDDESEADE